MIRALAFALAVVLAAPTVSAQPAGPPGIARRERIKKKIRAMRAFTLTEELQLDETTAGRLFPALAKWDDEFDRLLQQRADIEKRLKGADAIKDPRALDKLVDEAVANQRAFWDAQDKRLSELRKILTPAQTARLLVVLPALEKKIENQLMRAIKGGGGPRAGGKGGELGKNPYGDDGDDDDVQLKPPR
jgi:hypothetical protein